VHGVGIHVRERLLASRASCDPDDVALSISSDDSASPSRTGHGSTRDPTSNITSSSSIVVVAAPARCNSKYIALNIHIKTGQTSDRRTDINQVVALSFPQWTRPV